MDRNSVTGFVLIALILIGYTYFTSPSQEEIDKIQLQRDSIAQVEDQKRIERETLEAQKVAEVEMTEDVAVEALPDSLNEEKLNDQFGSFANAAQGEREIVVLENELLKLDVSTKGGRPITAELKDYKTYGGTELYLFDEDSSRFNFNFFFDNRLINTEDLYFEPNFTTISNDGEEQKSLSMRLYAGSEDKYLELLYILKPNTYLIDFTVNVVGLEDLLRANNQELAFNWSMNALSKEKGKDSQYLATTIYYKYVDDNFDYISETSDDVQELEASTKWISFKQQFFSAAVIAKDRFDKVNGQMETKKLESSKKYTKFLGANITLDFDDMSNASFPMSFYFGPNHFQTLQAIGYDLEQQIDLGWGLFGWVNEYLIIPVFNVLDNFNLGYGLIILLLTLFIKLLLSPLTYKNYLSSAKQKVLKPEIDELNAKHKDGDAMKKQQASMALYKKAGVNPMAGCIPMVLQFPILIAMYRFFPSSIELRQQSFLWADDLSSYDSIYDLGFEIPFYGDHISLFTLLMAVSTFLYTKYNTQTAAMGGAQGQQMKIMMYMMPFFFLGFFNNFASGLSYYYFLSNIISMIQQWVIKRFFINEDEIHRKIQENKKNPKKTKVSKFQRKLEDMAKQRGYDANKKK